MAWCAEGVRQPRQAKVEGFPQNTHGEQRAQQGHDPASHDHREYDSDDGVCDHYAEHAGAHEDHQNQPDDDGAEGLREGESREQDRLLPDSQETVGQEVEGRQEGVEDDEAHEPVVAVDPEHHATEPRCPPDADHEQQSVDHREEQDEVAT